jgi:hypothetical protein
MKSDLATIEGFSGLNQAQAPTAISDRQLVSGSNFDLIEGRLVRRRGLARQFTSPRSGTPGKCTSGRVLGMKYFDTGVLLLACSDAFAISSGLATVDLAADADIDPSPNEADEKDTWDLVDNNGVIWAARRASGVLWRITEAEAATGGLTAPSAAPTLANGGAGLVSAGSYEYLVTFVTDIGDESAESAVATIVLAGASEVDLTALPVSSQARCTLKNIYRSLPNDSGTWWLVDTIDNADTTYTDNTPNSLLGDQLDSAITAPPDEVLGIEKWGERLWTHDGVEVSCSLPGQFETFGETFDSFDARGDRKVIALHAWDTRLMVGTTDAIFQITESGVDAIGVRFSVTPFTTDHGCVAPHTVKSAEGRLFWLAFDGIYMSDGGPPRRISEDIRVTFGDYVTAASAKWSYAYIDAEEGEYCISIPRVYCDDSGNNGAAYAPMAPTSYVERAGAKKMAFGNYNSYTIVDESGADQGVSRWPIRGSFRMKQISKPGARIALRKVCIDVCGIENGDPVPAPAEDITVKVYQDGDVAAVRSATVNLGTEPNRTMKRIGLGQKLSGWRPLCASFGVEILYQREPKISINSAMFEMDLFGVQGRAL